MRRDSHLALRTKFSVRKKGEKTVIKIKTDLADGGAPRTHKECSKGWSKRCAHAKGKKCNCACGGTNHGQKRRWPKILKWRK